MVLRVVGLLAALVLVAVVGELSIRRNRRTRASRIDFANRGVAVTGRVVSLDKVSAGKYGSFKWSATIAYEIDGRMFSCRESWWPGDGHPEQVGAPIPLLVDPADGGSAVVAGNAAPGVEGDRFWRLFELVMAVGVIVAFALSL